MNSTNEIFRHFRPLELNARGEVVNQRNGGISFLCFQREDSTVDFWVYVCPMDAGFSAKAAVARLREASKVAAPWGRFTPNGSPLLVQLCAEVKKTELPSTVPNLLLEIILINLEVLYKQHYRFPDATSLYHETEA